MPKEPKRDLGQEARNRVATLFRGAREDGRSQVAAARGATAALRRAEADGLAWAKPAAGLALVVRRPFVARMELGNNVAQSPETVIKARALAVFYGVEWLDVLTAAGIVEG